MKVKEEQSAWNNYEGYKRIDKGDAAPLVGRPVRSLLHRYYNELSHSAFLEYMELAYECRTEGEADLLARAIIVVIEAAKEKT